MNQGNGTQPGSESGIGRVAAHRGAEATSERFTFWVPDSVLVEKTALVKVDGEAGGEAVTFYGLVTEVLRQSRRADVHEEADQFDGKPDEEAPIQSRGTTFAECAVLGSKPSVFTPPKEEAMVFPADAADAEAAYGMDAMERPATIGMVRNGGSSTAGPARINTDYITGALGGHVNVSGIAGVGSKSSFLLTLTAQLVREAREYARAHPEDGDRIEVRPVVLNVKSYDLFSIGKWSREFTPADLQMWREMGWDEPQPFRDLAFFAPQQKDSGLAVDVGISDPVKAYSWSLRDLLEQDLFGLLFDDGDREDANFSLLISDVERMLAREVASGSGVRSRQLRDAGPARTFQQLLDWFDQGLQAMDEDGGMGGGFDLLLRSHHHPGTVRRFYRRLRRIVNDSTGLFRMDDSSSNPLKLLDVQPFVTSVVDIFSLSDQHLQRFVLASLLQQAIRASSGAQNNRRTVWLFVIDELNRFAPKGASDGITRLVETVAAEMRSRGIILLGAQQQASLVSPRVVENAAVRVLGRTGGHELRQDTYDFLPPSLRDYVQKLSSSEKTVWQPDFRQPLNVRLPRPPWAMRPQEACEAAPDAVRAHYPDDQMSGPAPARRARALDEIPF